MIKAHLGMVLRHIQQLIRPGETGELTDGQLLARYTASGDDFAFAELVRRHGSMVLGVCRRLLGNVHDAEDAFQATFLVFARKAAAIRQHEAVGGWLYQVAHHLALKTKADAARRRRYERWAADMLPTDGDPVADATRLSELGAAFDEELGRLPDKYRTPLVLCYLEGKTSEQAARELGRPVGSMSRHLNRGKELLRERLSGRGVALASGIAALCASEASAQVAPRLLDSTVRAALRHAAGQSTGGLVSARAVVLAKEMGNTMLMSKLKIAIVLTLAVGAAGTSALIHHGMTATAQAAAAEPAPPGSEAPRAVDALGDPLPPGAVMRMGTTRLRHGATVNYVAYAADGKTMLTAGRDDTVRLWDAETGKEIRRFATDAKPADGMKEDDVLGQLQIRPGVMIRNVNGLNTPSVLVALAPDGKSVVIAGKNGAIQVCDTTTGKEICQVKRRPNGIAALAFSPDSKVLAVRGGDNVTVLCDAATGKETRQLKLKVEAVKPKEPKNDQERLQQALQDIRRQQMWQMNDRSVVFSADGKIIVTVEQRADGNPSVQVWDAATGKELKSVKPSQPNVIALSCTPDSKAIAFASSPAIHLCDPETGKELRQIKANGVRFLAFSPDGKTVATRSGDEAVRLWDAEKGDELRKLGEANAAPDNRLQARLLAINGMGGAGMARDLAFTPNGKMLATAAGNTVRLWEVATGKEVPVGGHQAPVNSLHVTPDGKILLSRGADNTIRRWNTANGKELSQFALPAGTTLVAFAPDGLSVALAGQDSNIRRCDTTTGKELSKFTGVGAVNGGKVGRALANTVGAMTFSKDGKMLASRGSSDNILRVFDVAKGAEIKQIALVPDKPADNNGGPAVQVFGGFGGTGSIRLGVAFSPDGRTVVTPIPGNGQFTNVRGAGGEAKNGFDFWDVATGKRGRRILVPQLRGVSHFTFSPDGRLFATENSDQTITLWEVASCKERCTLGKPANGNNAGVAGQFVVVNGASSFPGTVAGLTTMAFAPDGRFIASRQAGKVRIWDVTAAKEVKQFTGHDGDVVTLDFAPDGKTVISGGNDTTILCWDMRAVKPEPLPTAELSDKQVGNLWADLTSDNGAQAGQAIRNLNGAAKQAVPIVRAQLKPAAAIDPKKIEQWIGNLDSDKFRLRQEAAEELEKLGDLARPALEKLLASKPPLETQKRAEALLEKVVGGILSSEQLRTVRAIELLERIGGSDARQVLDSLAQGAPGALPTREAAAALKRINR